MRRKLYLVGAAVVALATVIAGLGVASAAPPSARSSDDGSSEVIHLRATNPHNTDLDLGEQGPSAGDQQIGVDDLYQNGKRVGQAGIDAQILLLTDDSLTAQLLVTLSLPKGDITLHGTFTENLAAGPKPFVLAITGGTGAYRTARGQAKVALVPGTEDTRYTLQLVR
jgi:hypothetical protein